MILWFGFTVDLMDEVEFKTSYISQNEIQKGNVYDGFAFIAVWQVYVSLGAWVHVFQDWDNPLKILFVLPLWEIHIAFSYCTQKNDQTTFFFLIFVWTKIQFGVWGIQILQLSSTETWKERITFLFNSNFLDQICTTNNGRLNKEQLC